MVIFGMERYTVTHASIRGSDTVGTQGGKLTINYGVTDPKKCPTDVDIAITRDDVVVWRHRGVATRMSKDWNAQVNIPPLPPGQYEYATRFLTKCTDRLYATDAPPIRFQVKGETP